MCQERSSRGALCVAMLAMLMPGAIASARQGADPFTMICWNMESGDADPDFLAIRIGATQGCDLWGLSEVRAPEDGDIFRDAAGLGEDRDGDGEDDEFEAIVGSTGAGDKLAIVFNPKRLKRVDSFELHSINPQGRFRSPLVAEFEGRSTGQRFLFVVNHLARGNASARHTQASLLNQWAEDQGLPVIAAGDFNFDYDVVDGDQPDRHDPGFDRLTDRGVFTWVQPGSLVKTQVSPRFNSVLDFVFVSKPALGWTATSVILVEPGDDVDDDQRSDHRPVLATFELTGPAPVPPVDDRDLRQRIIERISKLETELRELRELVEQMDANP